MAEMLSSALVLVAVVPQPRDLEIARLLGWYRVPLRRAPKVIEVDYLAFYQPGSYGAEHRWMIEKFAEVRGHELTTRGQLFLDEPNHPRANEEYFKIAIGPLQDLAHPIPARSWKRISFLYTTGEYLDRATTIKDLVVRTEERQVFWRSLRERALNRGSYQTNELSEFDLDPAILGLLLPYTKTSLSQVD